MKKKLFLILLCIAGMSAKAADVPQWATALINNNPGLIDSVSVRPADPKAPDYTTCVVYYNQPLQHAVPNSPRFHMQALVTVNNTVDYATAVNHVYCSGYNLTDAFYARPSTRWKARHRRMTDTTTYGASASTRTPVEWSFTRDEKY